MNERVQRSRFDARRLSRRKVLAGTALGAVAVVAAACGGSRSQAPNKVGAPATSSSAGAAANASDQPKRGGILARNNRGGTFPTGVDPHKAQGSYVGWMGFFYQSLIRHNPLTYEVEPEIAQKWEQPSETEYLFTLNPGVKWHNKPPVNGRTLTADDVVFSLKRAGTNDPQYTDRTLLGVLDRIEAPDQSHVRVTSKQPYVATLFNLTDEVIMMVAPEAAANFGDKPSTADKAIGTGAFVLDSVSESGWSVVRNKDYWKPGLPYLDGVKMTVITDPLAEWAAFQSGQIDIAVVQGKDANQVSAQPGKNWTGWWKSNTVYQIRTNTAKAPFNDLRVGRGLRLLVDHQEAVSAWANTSIGRGALRSYFSDLLDAWDFTQEEYPAKFLDWKQPKDNAVKEGLAMLNAAGFTRDNPLKFDITADNTTDTGQTPAALLLGQFKRLGGDVVQPGQIRIFDNPTHSSMLQQGNFQVDFAGRGSIYEPDWALSLQYRTGGSANYGKYSDPNLDQMIDRQRTMFDVGQRKAFVKDVLTYLISNAPCVSFCGLNYLNVAQPKVKGGLLPDSSSTIHGFQYEHIWLDT